MITGINESKTLTKDISYKCKYKPDGAKYNSNQFWKNDKCLCECKKIHVCEKVCVWNPATCNCKNGKYLASIMHYSNIICDVVIESYDEKIKTIPQILMERK